MNHERTEDMPLYLKWVMTFINRIGFPILVCMWLAYQQFVSDKEKTKALFDVKEALFTVNSTLEKQNVMMEQQNKILRRRSGRDD